jgi:hypothetical protein
MIWQHAHSALTPLNHVYLLGCKTRLQASLGNAFVLFDYVTKSTAPSSRTHAHIQMCTTNTRKLTHNTHCAGDDQAQLALGTIFTDAEAAAPQRDARKTPSMLHGKVTLCNRYARFKS